MFLKADPVVIGTKLNSNVPFLIHLIKSISEGSYQFFVKGKLLVKGGANELIQMTKKQINDKIERIQGVKKDASKKQVKEK